MSQEKTVTIEVSENFYDMLGGASNDKMVLVNGEKSELDKLKELYATGDYICYAKDEISDFRALESCTFASTKAKYKLIHKDHAHIAEAVAKNSSVEVEWTMDAEDLGRSSIVKFFENYDKKMSYRLKESAPIWWKPENYEYFYSIDQFGEVEKSMFQPDEDGELLINFANCYKTKEQAKIASKAMQRHNRLLKWVLDFQGDLEGNFVVWFDHDTEQHECSDSSYPNVEGLSMYHDTAEALCKVLNDGSFSLDSEV